MTETSTIKRKWIPTQLSLRTLLLLVFICSLPLALIAHRLNRYHVQKAAVSSLQSDHSDAYASYSFGDAWYLELYGNHKSDSFKHLSVFPNLVRLRAPCSSITNNDLSLISQHRSIQMLDLIGASIDDDGIQQLATLDRLVILWVNNTNVTQTGVDELQRSLPNCDIRHVPGPGPW